jgi:hypothetical protein
MLLTLLDTFLILLLLMDILSNAATRHVAAQAATVAQPAGLLAPNLYRQIGRIVTRKAVK